MSTLLNDIIQKTQKAKSLLTPLEEVIVQLIPANNAINGAVTVSNTNLLFDALITFYSDTKKAEYFPYSVDIQISAYLSKVIESLNTLTGNRTAPTNAVNVVTVADQLYSVCLQHGLITFGFNQKEATELVVDMRLRRKAVRKTANSIDGMAQEILRKTEEAAIAAQTKFSQDTDKLRTDLESAKKECDVFRAVIQTNLDSLNKSHEEFEDKSAAIIKMIDELAKKQEESNASAAEVTENARSIKTELEAVRNLRSKAKDEMEQILGFYSEIEEHQKSMRDLQKEASGKYNELSQKYDESQTELKNRTDSIVAQNEKLQEDIKKHLQKAVGVSLFSAFDQRRKGLGWGKVLWALVMIVAVCAGGSLSWWLAQSLGSSGIESAFFVKLSAIIPVTFMILFAARQYSNERRTEEEYAFKSAISVSLEPYKDLLQRIADGGHAEQATFVENLLLEVFDNPVKRIYADATAKSEEDEIKAKFKMIKKILEISKGYDAENVRKILEMLGQHFGFASKQTQES